MALTSASVPAGTSSSVDSTDRAPAGCSCCGQVGNVNCDFRDEITLSDISLLIDHFFVTHCHLPNRDEANCDGDALGEITLGDLVALVDHVFISNGPLPYCPGAANTPPQTSVVAFEATRTFINGAASGYPITGVPIRWRAVDRVDHPYYPPPFECEYRVYGPYTDAQLAEVTDRFMVPVFELNDGTLYRYGEYPPARFVICDTIYLEGTRLISCDSVLVDTISGDNQFGTRETIFDVDNAQLAVDLVYGHIAARSGTSDNPWTQDSSTVLFDLLADRPDDTTRLLNFIFWARARDPLQGDLCDPTPVTAIIRLIDPKFERNVMVVEWTNTADENGPRKLDSVTAYWQTLVNYWSGRQAFEIPVPFDRARDYGRISAGFTGEKLLKAVMSHRILVLLQDGAVASNWAKVPSERRTVLSAIQAGASAWLAGRVPAGAAIAGSGPTETVFDTLSQRCFGAASYRFTGWLYYSMVFGERIEDFAGAAPTEDFRGPGVTVDSAALHARYRWDSGNI